jgi:predicted 3-demethylubiquinone-9 3-methyltransferase (glyoxalase superfamily)
VFNGEKVMSKIAPCLWFKDEAEEAANFYVSLLPDSRIDRVQKNVMDSPAGKVGSVLVIEFALAGQRSLALNGDTRFEYTHAISFRVECADQAEVGRWRVRAAR